VRAVILAAGRGDRLRDVIGEGNKCLAPIGGSTLLERQIRSLRGCGIDAITIVAGYRAADIRRVCDDSIDIVLNTDYDTTNSLYSLWLTRERLRGGFVVLNGDVLFHDQLLGDLLTSRDEDALLMAAHRGEDYSDEEMKIRVRAGCVADIAKTLPPDDTDGENVGIAKFGVDGAAVLVEALDEAVAGGEGTRHFLPRAFATFARRRPLRVVETRGFPWIEIDFPEDYHRACADVLPAIAGPGQSGARAEENNPSGGGDERAGRLVHHV
jgi:L-glutamine-phosphate cytidylyltransferase